MKALSLIQPWASLIGDGRKTIETRTWATSYRGPVLIVSSKAMDQHAIGLAIEFGYEPTTIPLGVAICTAELVDCRPFQYADERHALVRFDPMERRFAWVLRDVRRVEPVAIKGALGVYEVDDALIRHLEPVAPNGGAQ